MGPCNHKILITERRGQEKQEKGTQRKRYPDRSRDQSNLIAGLADGMSHEPQNAGSL